jgi:hypothetical protein
MVGGVVIGLARGPEDTLLHVRGRGGESHDTTCIRVVERRRDNGRPVVVGIGDEVWWQGGDAMWTPKVMKLAAAGHRGCGNFWDIHLPRVGYSFGHDHVR